MRYAIFTDIHANLEALEAVLGRIDELAKEKPIDQIWFLGDLVGYGPNPNECISKLRERTDVIIAGNHDWAAVGKLDLEDFSAAARISAEWTAEQLTVEHREFLSNLPERLEIGECTLVHGSPYGPLWEYLTSEVLAERSFQYFSSRYCLVGHTHVPVIFQQPDTVANTPTLPLGNTEQNLFAPFNINGTENHLDLAGAEAGVEHEEIEDIEAVDDDDDEDTAEMAAIVLPAQQTKLAVQSADSAYKDPESGLTVTEKEANIIHETRIQSGEDSGTQVEPDQQATNTSETHEVDEGNAAETSAAENTIEHEEAEQADEAEEIPGLGEEEQFSFAGETPAGEDNADDEQTNEDDEGDAGAHYTTSEGDISNAEDRLNNEIEELLTLLGLSQSMVQVTNEMLTPPEGHWEAPRGYRAIINPGGVGQPRDGDPRAAFMIYDTERGFEFYRVAYPFEKTQEKIIEAGLPQYLAVRLAFGR
jgi:diadenosine tetraphosphatase ApaH/serine/threonine PP2A family protein phosphatase